jgi:hypothetical protein
MSSSPRAELSDLSAVMKLLFALLAAFCPVLLAEPVAGTHGTSAETTPLEQRFRSDTETLRNLLVQTGVWLRDVRSLFGKDDLDAANLKTIESWFREGRESLADRVSATTPEARSRWCEQAEKLFERWKGFEDQAPKKNTGPFVVSVRGLVSFPGIYRRPKPLTLLQATRAAKCCEPDGRPACVALYRNAHVKIYNLLNKDFKDPVLRSGDMLVVESHQYVFGYDMQNDCDPFTSEPHPYDLPPVFTPEVEFTPPQIRDILGQEALDALGIKIPTPPARIRVQTQIIEMPLAAYMKITRIENSDQPGTLHQAARKLVGEGKAKITTASVITAKAGETARLESVREIISPCEAEPPEGGNFSSSANPPPATSPWPKIPYLRPPASSGPGGFETRNVGEFLEIEADFENAPPGFVHLRIAPEYVTLVGMTTWQTWKDRWGRGDARRPLYYTQRTNTAFVLPVGVFQLACIFVPLDPNDNPDPSRKSLLFVKVDGQANGTD